MSPVIRGRFTDPGDREETLEVFRADTGEFIEIDEVGRFRIDLAPDADQPEEPDEILLRVRRGPGRVSEVSLDAGALDGEVVVVAPQPVEDPREAVAAWSERLTVEREARGRARQAVADEVAQRQEHHASVRMIVDAVLRDVARRRGGDVTWRLDRTVDSDGSSLQDMTLSAFESAKSSVAERRHGVRATPGVLEDGEELPTGELVSRLAGGPLSPEVLRRPAAEVAEAYSRLRDGDGLPTPIHSDAPTDAASQPDGASAGNLGTLVSEKVADMVEAARLPEDPPLLVAEAAVSGSGAEVELARGIADVTAFHDFHELIIGMPSVWTEVFDPHFVELVEQAAEELVSAGTDLSPFSEDGDRGISRLLLDELRRLNSTFDTTGAVALRAPPPRGRRSPADTAGNLVSHEGRLLLPSPDRFPPPPPPSDSDTPGPWYQDWYTEADTRGVDDRVVNDPSFRWGLLHTLEEFLKGDHAFTVYPADGAERAVNFGVLLTWRQRWEPLSYQTGDIAHTTTLAPAEKRKVVSERIRKTKRYTSEAESSQSSRSLETTDTVRAETEILRKATATTNFHLTSSGSTNLLVQDGSFTTSTTRDVDKIGNDTRKRFREAVLKAAQEFREEHSVEVKTESEDIFEEETTAELQNPNDEIAVTVVFYSLQRRYRVAEHLNRATPVVMVAMPVPGRSEITTAWLVRHAWILERNLLAERFRPALQYLTTSFLGDTEALSSLRAAVEQQKEALEGAEHRLVHARAMLEQRSESLRELRRELAGDGGSAGLFDLPGLSLAKDIHDFAGGFFSGGSDEAAQRERQAMLLAAAEDELARAEREAREAESQVVTATNAYQEAVREYVAAKRTQRNHEVRIAELRLHVADNILHYMQAIWASQPPDQRFFELHTVQVPNLTADVVVTSGDFPESPGVGGLIPESFTLDFTSDTGSVELLPLAEVADLDRLVGFKGNYALFPMREGNALTDVILAPYLDEHEILRDPNDPAASWTLEELRAYADWLRARVDSGDISQEDFDEKHAPFLRSMLEELITDPHPPESTVIVPTDSLYAELLTSGGSLMERFKKEHRSLDVAKVRAEIRAAELDNLRRAARLHEGELADPGEGDFQQHLVRHEATQDD